MADEGRTGRSRVLWEATVAPDIVIGSSSRQRISMSGIELNLEEDGENFSESRRIIGTS